MSGKHNGNIFETFKASLVVLIGIILVKLHFTKFPLAAIFFNKFYSKSMGFLQSVISMTNWQLS